MRKNNFLTIGVAVVTLAGGVVVGTMAGAAIAQTIPSTTAASDPDAAVSDDKEFPKNKAGKTYGSAFGATYETIPDLVSVISDEGLDGYVSKGSVFPPPPQGLDEIRNLKSLTGQVLVVTESDGVTVVGKYTLQ